MSAQGYGPRIDQVVVKWFKEWASEISLMKHIEYGLILGRYIYLVVLIHIERVV